MWPWQFFLDRDMNWILGLPFSWLGRKCRAPASDGSGTFDMAGREPDGMKVREVTYHNAQ
jgi:hypothetical protein